MAQEFQNQNVYKRTNIKLSLKRATLNLLSESPYIISICIELLLYNNWNRKNIQTVRVYCSSEQRLQYIERIHLCVRFFFFVIHYNKQSFVV